VRGHDHVIDTVLGRLYENLMLRRSRRGAHSGGPLASFLLVGQEGIGKRYLMRVIAKLLYGTSAIELFDCRRLTAASLTGTKDREGVLPEIVRRSPCTLLLFENIDKASQDVASVLLEIMTTGRLTQPGATAKVSLADTTLALTTTRACGSLEALASAELGEAVFHQRAVEILGEETRIDHGLTSAVTDICFCAPPTDRVKAEVVALLMKIECRDHGIELSRVDPEILATQVIQLDDGAGFQHAAQRVKKLLRKPLVAAAPERPPSLSLRVRARAASPLRN
jgi:midasin (ATPase involved in ribosome maturation)